jgi:hypothetical protein
MRLSRIVRLIAVLLVSSVCGAATAGAATPMLTQRFVSSSGRTAILYFTYDAAPCGGGVSCGFRGLIKVFRGYDQAEVFLSGFRLEGLRQADAVSQATVSVQKFRYDPVTGAMEVGVSSGIGTASGQQYATSVTFVVLLTRLGVASFTPISTGCGGVASCSITRSLPGAVPAGMQYIGLATSNWSLGSSGPLVLNTLSGHIDALTVSGPQVDLRYLCMMQDGSAANRMWCEWSAKVVAFDPTEMEQNGSSLFPQYTFLGWNTPSRQAWTEHATSPSRTRLTGFLDAFEGLTLTYQTFPQVPGTQNPVWLIESMASNFRLDPNVPDTALTDYGIFLGTRFGNYATAQNYGFQLSRAIGLLH